jgi:FKBP-type peptidyl-prolyl cis-trans isomerase FkpA
LYIPPTLGYGSREIKDNLGNVIIPANSILIFDIELLNF